MLLRARAIVVVLAAALAHEAAAQAPPSPAPILAVGDSVPAFDADAIDGSRVHVAFPKGGDTVLLFFLSGCPACHHMLPEWNRAYGNRPKSLKVVGVLLDKEPPGFFMATPIAFPVLRSPGGEFSRTFKLSRVPLTLRVGPGGKVVDVGLGPLDAIRLGELFRP
jgi:hypothetical protein